MASLKSTEKFTHRVENYVKYRPDYPSDMLDDLLDMAWRTEDQIADIGSGTGIFSRQILERGCGVFGVEPNQAMREAAERALNKFSNYVSVNGTAEKTTLADQSVDHITCAQAFHWFDSEVCRAEFKRILRPNGKVLLTWNNRVVSSGVCAEYETLIRQLPDCKMPSEPESDAEKRTKYASFYKNGIYVYKKYMRSALIDLDHFCGEALSSSYAPLEDEDNHAWFMAELNQIFNRWQKNGNVQIEMETDLFLGEVRSAPLFLHQSQNEVVYSVFLEFMTITLSDSTHPSG